MDTNELLKKAGEKLQETKKQFESDEKRLNQLVEERGNLLALELIESRAEQKEKIKKLNKAIVELKDIIEGVSPVINGLKRKILSLKSQKEKEDLEKAKDDQVGLEDAMHTISKRLIPILKQANKLNSELKNYWVSWNELTVITGKAMTDKKVSLGSEEMLGILVGTIEAEWNGKGHRIRDFYNRIKL